MMFLDLDTIPNRTLNCRRLVFASPVALVNCYLWVEIGKLRSIQEYLGIATVWFGFNATRFSFGAELRKLHSAFVISASQQKDQQDWTSVPLVHDPSPLKKMVFHHLSQRPPELSLQEHSGKSAVDVGLACQLAKVRMVLYFCGLIYSFMGVSIVAWLWISSSFPLQLPL